MDALTITAIVITIFLIIKIISNIGEKVIAEKKLQEKMQHFAKSCEFIYIETIEENNKTMHFAYNFRTKDFVANANSKDELTVNVFARIPNKEIYIVSEVAPK